MASSIKRPKITAHRVNGLHRLEEAVKSGAHGIEFDVQISADGKLFLYHDCLPKDISGNYIRYDRFVNSMTMAELEEAGVEVTPFENLLDQINTYKQEGLLPKDFILHVELKSPNPDGKEYNMAAQTVAMLQEKNLLEQSIFRSFLPEHVIAANDAMIEILGTEEETVSHTCLLFSDGNTPQEDKDYRVEAFIHTKEIPGKDAITERLGFTPPLLSIRWSQATQDVIDKIKEEGFQLCCYTINKKEGSDKWLLKKNIIQQLDYVVTDQPEAMYQYLYSPDKELDKTQHTPRTPLLCVLL